MKYYQADLSDTSKTEEFGNRIVEENPEIGGIIHNAGIQRKGRFHELSLKDKNDLRNINQVAPEILNDVFIKHAMKKEIDFSITLNSSIQALTPSHYKIPYCSSKASAEAHMYSLQHEYGTSNRLKGEAPEIANGETLPRNLKLGMMRIGYCNTPLAVAQEEVLKKRGEPNPKATLLRRQGGEYIPITHAAMMLTDLALNTEAGKMKTLTSAGKWVEEVKSLPSTKVDSLGIDERVFPKIDTKTPFLEQMDKAPKLVLCLTKCKPR